MNARERILAVTVLGIVLLGGLGLMFYQFFLSPYRARKTNLEALQKQADTKEAHVNEIVAQRAQLERYRQQSLPADVDVARKEYGRYLDDLLRNSGFLDISVSPRQPSTRGVPTLANKTPIYTQLSYGVQGRATLESLVKMMEGFYRTGLLHQIKTLSISRPMTLQPGQRRDDLDVMLTVEALVVHGSEKRPTLMQVIDRRLAAADAFSALRWGPAGLGLALSVVGPAGSHGTGVLADPPREYSAIASKNIFFGPPVDATPPSTDPEVEPLKFWKLNGITIDYGRGGRAEAVIYDVFNDRKTHLATRAGFNQLDLVKNNQGAVLVQAKVIRIEERGLVFRVGLNARDPDEAGPTPYKNREEIYHLTKKDADTLVREAAIRSDDGGRVFWVDKGRWESLIADKVVTMNGRVFAFRWNLVKGHVVRDDGHALLLRVDDKYCSYRYGEGGRPPKPHEGYCLLHVGGSVAEALLTPLKEEEIKTLAAQ